MKMTAIALEKAMKSRMLTSAAWIQFIPRHGRAQIGVAICLGENLAKLWQSGDVIVFWVDGDHTVLHDEYADIKPETEIEVIGDLFDPLVWEKRCCWFQPREDQ